MDADHSLTGTRVADMLQRAVRERGRAPVIVMVDIGTVIRSRMLHFWASERRVQLLFTDPGADANPFRESFNSRFQIGYLNVGRSTNNEE